MLWYNYTLIELHCNDIAECCVNVIEIKVAGILHNTFQCSVHYLVIQNNLPKFVHWRRTKDRNIVQTLFTKDSW